MKTKLLFTVLLLGGLLAQAAAAELKIAVIDMQKVFQNYKRTKAVEKKLQEQMDVFRDYSLKLTAQLREIKKKYETARNEAQDSLTLTEAERQNRALLAKSLYEQYALKEAELKSYNQTRQEQMRETYEKMRGDILGEIRKEVRNRAVVEGIQLVLDKSGATMNDISAVVYHAPGMEISDAVIDALNRGYREPAPDSPAVTPKK